VTATSVIGPSRPRRCPAAGAAFGGTAATGRAPHWGDLVAVTLPEASTSIEGFNVGGAYREIERPRLLVFTWLPDWDAQAQESVVRFDLTEHNGVTTVRLTHSGLTSESARAHHQGWPQVLGWGGPAQSP